MCDGHQGMEKGSQNEKGWERQRQDAVSASAPTASPDPHLNLKALLQRQLGAARGQGSASSLLLDALHGHRELCGGVGVCRIWPQEDID